MKVGIVVPYSWSFWGAVVEHAELQAAALRELGVDTRTIIGMDPPGSFTRALHPRLGRHEDPPPGTIPVGRSVIVPANGSLPNIVLTPRVVPRMQRILERERFDLLHVHEPITPAIGTAALALWDGPAVGTFHASGELSWLKLAKPVMGFLLDRLDRRIAVSEQARASAQRYFPGEYEIVPNGVLVPPHVDPGGREHRVVFAGRHEPRKGLQVLLRAWPRIHRESGARLRIAGADPLAVRLLLGRLGVPDTGIDVLGFLSQDELTRAFACATPAVASDIPGYREVMTAGTAVACPPGDADGLADAVVALLADEERRARLGAAARRLAEERYAWRHVARCLLAVYESATATPLAA